jgi:hypothetical protein
MKHLFKNQLALISDLITHGNGFPYYNIETGLTVLLYNKYRAFSC